jgi:hypothetical protein
LFCLLRIIGISDKDYNSQNSDNINSDNTEHVAKKKEQRLTKIEENSIPIVTSDIVSTEHVLLLFHTYFSNGLHLHFKSS